MLMHNPTYAEAGIGVKNRMKSKAQMQKKERNAVAILFKFQWFFRHKMYVKKNSESLLKK